MNCVRSVVLVLALGTSAFAEEPPIPDPPLQPLGGGRVVRGELEKVRNSPSRPTTARFHFTARPAERVVLSYRIDGAKAEEVRASLHLGEFRNSQALDTLRRGLGPDEDPEDDEWTGLLQARLFAGGDYYLLLEFDAPAQYEVSLRTLSPGKLKSGEIKVGQALRGAFTEADALNDKGGFGEWFQRYHFQGAAQQQVAFQVVGNVHLDIRTADGEQVEGKWNSGMRYTAELPADGPYVLEVHAVSVPQTFGVGFEATPWMMEAPAEVKVQPLSPGQAVKGLFDEVEAGPEAAKSQTIVRRFSIEGRARQPIAVKLRAADATAHLILRRPLGSSTPQRWLLIAADHDDLGGPNAELKAVLPQDGQYLLEVIGDRLPGKQEAPYSLELTVQEPLPAPVPPPEPEPEPEPLPPGRGWGVGGLLTAFGGKTLETYSAGLGGALVVGYEPTPLLAVQAIASVDLAFLNRFYLMGLVGPGIRVGNARSFHARLSAGGALQVDYFPALNTFSPLLGVGARLDLLPLPWLVVSGQTFNIQDVMTLHLGLGVAL